MVLNMLKAPDLMLERELRVLHLYPRAWGGGRWERHSGSDSASETPKAHPLWHISYSNKDTPTSRTHLIMLSLPVDQALKSLSLWEAFSFKPPPSHSISFLSLSVVLLKDACGRSTYRSYSASCLLQISATRFHLPFVWSVEGWIISSASPVWCYLEHPCVLLQITWLKKV